MMQAAALKPLSGVTILVTRPIEQAKSLSEKLRELGATTIELPTIEIIPAENNDALDEALKRFDEYDWVVFTSVHGVRFFMKRMAELNIPLSALKQVMLAAIGPATASALESTVKKPELVPTEFLSWKIADSLGDVRGRRILLPRADIASKKLPDLLRERGALVEEVVAYRTVIPPDLTPDRLTSIFAGGVDLITFTSPSTVNNLASVLGPNKLEQVLSMVKVACIGPVTLEATKELGLTVDIVSKIHTIDALVEAIVDEIGTV
jgi:uroporphyrinogen III methyltransferase / synthase